MKSPTSVKQILASSSAGGRLTPLLRRIESLHGLNARLRRLLPVPLAQHCSIASVAHERMVILVSSSAWATRLRLLHPKIIKSFSDLRIKSVITQVAPATGPQHAPGPAREGPRRLSAQSSKLLIELAEAVPDPKLKDALRRLSRHGRRRS